MLNVNNRKTILLLSKKAFKSNRMRNFFAIIAIVLTTVLFTSFVTIGGSLISSIEEGAMRQVGTSYHAGLKNITVEQYNEIKSHELIEDISYSVVLGLGENQSLDKRQTEIRYSNDAQNAIGMFSMPTVGRLPENDHELATDTLVLELLGIPLELGQEVTLEYSVGDEMRTKTFELVGYWQGDPIMKASQVWLNRTFVMSELSDFKLNANMNFSDDYKIEEKIIKVISESGFSLDEISYGVNWAYFKVDFSASILPILGFILMIAASGYLMISNVFYISISKDVSYYGLLKTIGTTPAQIRRTIKYQALWLCCLGIPAGVLIGTHLGSILVPIVISVLNVDVVRIEINPFIMVISAFFSATTVLVSIVKPSKIAAHVSPIEALRNSETKISSKKKKTRSISLVRLAKENTLGNKKKTVFVVASLSLGLMILNITFSLANSFDMEKFIQQMISSDFVVADTSFFNINKEYSNQDTLNQDFFNELTQLKGIESVSKIYFSEPYAMLDSSLLSIPHEVKEKIGNQNNRVQDMIDELKNPKHSLHIYGLDENKFSSLNILEGTIDMNKLRTGKYVVVEAYDYSNSIMYYEIGDIVKLPNPQGDAETYEVLAIAEIPYNISIKHWHAITPTFFLPSQVFLSQIEEKAPMLTTIDVDQECAQIMESFLGEYVINNDINMMYKSKSTIMEEFQHTQRSYKTVGIVLSSVIAFVGIMNFINTIITSIHTRKLELAMMQSVGMTRRQTRTMLVLEGLFVIAISLLATLSIGSVLGFIGLRAFVSGSSVMKFYYTVMPSIVCAPILLIISVIVSYFSQQSVCKDSIVERLRSVA